MRSRFSVRLARFIAIGVIAAAGLMPSVASAGTEPLVLNVGTDQKLRVLNPWFAITVADYEIFQIQYELLVSFDINLGPAPGFAESWESSADGMTHTFHIRPGMLWSDGQPATCADAEYTYQFVLDVLDSSRGYVGSGYLEPYLQNTGLDSVECSDDLTLVAHTAHPSTLLTQAYVPILPKHVWSQYTMDQIGKRNDPGFFANEPPVVGSGPYVATSWEKGSFIRMERNPNYWGAEKGAPDALLFQSFTGADTMVQALRSGELDYVRGTGADQFDALATEPNIRVSEGYSNGYTYLSFNTRATQPGYHGSTTALEDQAFRDALGFALDRQALVDRVLNGHGVAGSTHLPPYQVKWHVEPDNPRDFNLDTANQRLDAANYPRGEDGRRVDHEGKPIELRLTWPSSEDHSTDAQFIKEWYDQIGIGVDAFVTEEGKLLDDLLGPPAGGPADWDFYMWGWVGDPDPTSLLSLFQTNQIKGGINDCFYSDDRYDELFDEQLEATTEEARLAAIDEMQQLFYDAACYHVLYYDSVLDAQRTDKFTNWTNQPPVGGTPIFGYGYPGYMALQDASAVPSPGPSTPAATLAPGETAGPATPAPSAAPTGNTGGDSTPLIIGAIALIVVIAGGFWYMRRRGPAVEEE
jgi:peptide/nickel transport system substrate-binding protein